MDLPPPSRKLARIAAKLSILPIELIEPVLKELPLHRILELLALPVTGSLLRAIHDGPEWKKVFRDLKHGSMPFERTWCLLNGLSWLCYKQSWMVTMSSLARNRSMSLYSHATAISPPTALEELNELSLNAFTSFISCLPESSFGNLYTAELQALCLFLPRHIFIYGKKSNESFFLSDKFKANTVSNDYRHYLENSPDEAVLRDVNASFLTERIWTLDEANKFLPYLSQAHRLLTQAYSLELSFLAGLYKQFPIELKEPLAPQTPRNNVGHIYDSLRQDAKRVLLKGIKKPRRVHDEYGENQWVSYASRGRVLDKKGGERGRERFTPHRFRYPHPALVPYDWCLRLFKIVTTKLPPSSNPTSYPPSIIPHLKLAMDGLSHIYQHGETSETVRLPRCTEDTVSIRLTTFRRYTKSKEALPKPEAELKWLESFANTVHWMAEEFPDIMADVKDADPCPVGGRIVLQAETKIMDAEDYRFFIAHESAQVVARQLRDDSDIRDDGTRRTPSLLALYMPPWSSVQTQRVAQQLVGIREIGPEVQKLVYESTIQKIRLRLKNADGISALDGGRIAFEIQKSARKGKLSDLAQSPNTDSATELLSPDDLITTARTLEHLSKKSRSDPGGSASKALFALVEQLELGLRVQKDSQDYRAPRESKAGVSWNQSVKEYVNALPLRQTSRGTLEQCSCYICQLRITEPHKDFPAMCVPCGNFNLAGSNLSLPQNLNLDGKTALVTGGRVNLGYHVARRLLRCGAKVIVSTRYPRDALTRYLSEPDAEEWKDRLIIVGADFRSARDAFQLAQQVCSIVDELHILINNAAQTLTDSVADEEEAIKKETSLVTEVDGSPVIRGSYEPRIRGGVSTHAAIGGSSNQLLTSASSQSSSDLSRQGSSWVQPLTQIPYEDIITTHSINTFVPLILIRELMLLFPDPGSDGRRLRKYPKSYIVNVSSREGIFERKPYHPAKNGHHVHTNMSKAALNMITETEAAGLWYGRRLAMNTVDPGYMSAAPEFKASRGGVRPLGWEDGAARVIWPIAVGEESRRDYSSRPVWGRFLKHYGAARVEPGLGR